MTAVTVWFDDNKGDGNVGYLRLQPKGLVFDGKTKQWTLLAWDYNNDRERAIPLTHMSDVIGGGVLPIGEVEAVRAAIGDYYHALDKREHGGVAAGQALDKIQAALGMRWEQGASLKDTRADTPQRAAIKDIPKPALMPTQKGVCISPSCDCMGLYGHCVVTGRLPI